MNSMTGFGRAEGQLGSSHIIVEVKTVNHRFLDVRFRLPGFLSALEIPYTQLLRDTFERGAFDVVIRHSLVQSAEGSGLLGTRFTVDPIAAESLMEAFKTLHKKFKIKFPPSPESFLLSNRVIVPTEEAASLKEWDAQIREIFQKALAELKSFRKVEGQKIRTLLENGARDLGLNLEKLVKLAPQQPAKVAASLEERIAQWGLSQRADKERLEWEIAFYADRIDITEELDRARCHLEEFLKLLSETKTGVGRRLDFLTQELHREFNTMGSKASVLEITQLVIEGKSTIEKLRQQVQNVE